MKSVMVHQFSQVPQVSVPRSVFNRNSGYKTTFDSGYLVPFFVDEALPGDTFKVKANMMARLATPVVPFMDNLFLETFFFAVPLRLVWDNFQRFMGEKNSPDDNYEGLIPQLTAPSGGFAELSLADYFGLPTKVGSISVSALPFRAYNLIYNEWFRAEFLQDNSTVRKGDSGDLVTDYPLLRRNKRFDYFTSANPWPTAYGVESSVGISGNAFVYGDGNALRLTTATTGTTSRVLGSANTTGLTTTGVNANNVAVGASFTGLTNLSGAVGVALKSQVPTTTNSAGLVADLSTASSITINDLRHAFAIQHLLEADARGGTRYTEILRAHFGVVSPDQRLQRPEYLGGGSQLININAVVQNSATDSTSPQGNLAAFGVVHTASGFVKSFVEHSIIIGLVNVRADLTYQQGIDRMWSRKERIDFYWPELANLGEQAVLNKEIYAQGTDADDGVFGYQERYAEYRYKPSKITGRLRSSSSLPLDMWHLSQNFEALPQLNSTFIQDDPPIDRVVAVQDEPQFIFDSYIECNCVRPMPVYGVPGLRRL